MSFNRVAKHTICKSFLVLLLIPSRLLNDSVLDNLQSIFLNDNFITKAGCTPIGKDPVHLTANIGSTFLFDI